MGTLYVVGTPIGNMEDITFRQLETLKNVDFIAAEDTRVTLKLLNRFEISKQLVSFHGHSSRSCAENIVARIENGENAAIVTDAGMPCISDPGEILVRICAQKSIDVKVVPGPSAVVSALAISGLDTSRFAFEGFLSMTKKQRTQRLESIKNDSRTLIFYEAPHKLRATLEDLYRYLGNRRIALCRELTKIYEEVLRMTLSEAIAYYEAANPKGEFVLVVEGASPDDSMEELTEEQAVDLVKALVSKGKKLSDACREIAGQTKYSKSFLYSEMLREEEEMQ